MKKVVAMMLVFTCALLMLTGCLNQSSYKLTVSGDGNYTVVSSPDISRGGSFGWQENPDGTYTAGFILKNDGEYYLVLKDEAGTQYKITITRKSGKVEAKTDDGLTLDLKKE